MPLKVRKPVLKSLSRIPSGHAGQIDSSAYFAFALTDSY